MDREEARDEGGFVRIACSQCGRAFWSDWGRLCEECRLPVSPFDLPELENERGEEIT